MEDAKIVQLYWDRNEQAIPVTADKYGNYCRSIATNILGNREDAEECVNDTYLNAWNAMPPNRPDVLPAFLGKITRNLSFNRYKRNTAEKRGGGELPAVLSELSDCVSGRDDVEQMLDRRALLNALDEFLQMLPPVKRALFIRRYWYTDSVSDLAAQYGMREGAVSTTLYRLRRQLRSHLLERGIDT